MLQDFLNRRYINEFGIVDFFKLNNDILNNNYSKGFNLALIKFKIKMIRGN